MKIMQKVYQSVGRLISYAENRLGLDPRDEHFVRGGILAAIGLSTFEETKVAPVTDERPDNVLAEFVSACVENKLFEKADAPRICDEVMGSLMLPPSRLEAQFDARARKVGAPKAMDEFYQYCVAGDYVKKSALEKNPRFESNGLIVTINKSKPEFRDAKAAAKQSAAGAYPKCSICHENEGCADRMKRTLRTVDITLGGQKWFWQYSPYGYFDRHGIAVNYEHIPMHVDEATFGRLMDFVDAFPHFFIGSNAALPRIGGSVLAHDHYQGGGEVLPLHKAGVKLCVKDDKNPDVKIGILDWRGSVVRVSGKSRRAVTAVCEKIRAAWVGYDKPELGIIAEDGDGAHNAISPTVVKHGDTYDVNIILRNNITSEQFPDGVFHAHPEFHSIKKESIGLIEAQGLFILPGRLDEQLKRVCSCVEKGKLDKDLEEFALVFDETRAIFDSGKVKTVEDAMKEELGSICSRILENTAVFKTDDAFVTFLKEAGFRE